MAARPPEPPSSDLYGSQASFSASANADASDLATAMDQPLEPGVGRPAPEDVRRVEAERTVPARSQSRTDFIAQARELARAAAAEADHAVHSARAVPSSDSWSIREKLGRAVRTVVASETNEESASSVPSRAAGFLRTRRARAYGLAAVAVAMVGIAAFYTSGPPRPAPVAAGQEPAAPVSVTGESVAPASEPAPEAAPPVTSPRAALPAPEVTGSVSPEAATAPASAPAAADGPERASVDGPEPAPATAAASPTNGEAPETSPAPSGSADFGGVTSFTGMGPSVALPPSGVSIPRALQSAVDAGDARAEYELAERLSDGQTNDAQSKRVLALYGSAARKGFVPAQYRVGSMYEKGIGTKVDIAEARKWYEMAADKGNAKAMHNLAVLYAEGGLTGKPDYAKASELFRGAAERGLRDSQYNLAVLATKGLGMPVNVAEGYRWFALAAAQGDKDAQTKRDQLGARLDADLRKRIDDEIASFVPKAEDPQVNEATLPRAAWDSGDGA